MFNIIIPSLKIHFLEQIKIWCYIQVITNWFLWPFREEQHDISLFERLINSGIPYSQLNTQHRYKENIKTLHYTNENVKFGKVWFNQRGNGHLHFRLFWYLNFINVLWKDLGTFIISWLCLLKLTVSKTFNQYL